MRTELEDCAAKSSPKAREVEVWGADSWEDEVCGKKVPLASVRAPCATDDAGERSGRVATVVGEGRLAVAAGMVIVMGVPPVAGVVGEDSFLGAEFGLAVNPLAAVTAFVLVLIWMELSSGKRTPFAEDFETDKA